MSSFNLCFFVVRELYACWYRCMYWWGPGANFRCCFSRAVFFVLWDKGSHLDLGLTHWARLANQPALRRSSCLDLLSARIRSMGHNTQILTWVLRIKFRSSHMCSELSLQPPTYFSVLFFIILFVVGFSRQVSLCSPSCPGIYSVDQAGMELTEICLPLPLKCWN